MGCARHHCSTHTEYRSSLCFLKHSQGDTAGLAHGEEEETNDESTLATIYICTTGLREPPQHHVLYNTHSQYSTHSSFTAPISLFIAPILEHPVLQCRPVGVLPERLIGSNGRLLFLCWFYFTAKLKSRMLIT